MASAIDIKRRIKSVKNTAQITKAMQMVAASKMAKAQKSALAGRAYALKLNEILSRIRSSKIEFSSPFMEERKTTKECILLITSDKGLCGALNTNVIKKAISHFKDDTIFVTAGKKGKISLAKLKKNIKADFAINDPIAFNQIKTISTFLSDLYLKKEIDKVSVIYSDYISTIKQEPTYEQILPIKEAKIDTDLDLTGNRDSSNIEETNIENIDYIFEPSIQDVFQKIVPLTINFRIYQLFMESKASEHSARMVSMKTATDNANQLIKDLTLEYNKVRQASITSELLDIVTAMKALE